jgi:hypothetical protein
LQTKRHIKTPPFAFHLYAKKRAIYNLYNECNNIRINHRKSSNLLDIHLSKLPKLDLNIPQPLRLGLIRAPLLNSELIRPPLRDILRLVVREEHLESLLNNPAASVIKDHDGAHGNLELGGEGHEAELLVDLGDELGGAAESDAGDHQDAVVHALVLLDGLAEGAALVVDGES